jgi:hypothetical protein
MHAAHLGSLQVDLSSGRSPLPRLLAYCRGVVCHTPLSRQSVQGEQAANPDKTETLCRNRTADAAWSLCLELPLTGRSAKSCYMY